MHECLFVPKCGFTDLYLHLRKLTLIVIKSRFNEAAGTHSRMSAKGGGP